MGLFLTTTPLGVALSVTTGSTSGDPWEKTPSYYPPTVENRGL